MRRLFIVLSALIFPILVSVAAYLLAPDVLRGFRYEFVTVPVKLDQRNPTGELIAGKRIEQTIDLDSNLLSHVGSIQANETMCLGVLFSTYVRHNDGQVRISLMQDSIIVSRIIEMAYIKDNVYKWLCFEKNEWLRFTVGDALLVIEGIDGREGSSVTAWLSADAPHGPALVDAVPNSKGLVFGIVLGKADRVASIVRWAFVLLSSLGIELILGVLFSTLMVPVKDNGKEIDPYPQ